MVPRGLRLRKFPTTIFSEQFKAEWEELLNDSSLRFVKLIIKHEETALTEITSKISELQNSISKYEHHPTYVDLNQKISGNIVKMETLISQTKENKFLRDLQDYKSNHVYEWPQNRSTKSTPKSILKNHRNYKKYNRNNKPARVSFSETDADSMSGTEPNEMSVPHTPEAASSPLPQSRKAKSAKNDAGAASITAVKRTRRHQVKPT
ncbi:uncharacterized protein LOC130303239 [Hyla sarda]|uniref:uncharacterized protein LOC130303239 n=1 Tax=Hyla sarda TaxID=327740 RepID=UPI0024C407C4|nr:uncharacterized protein LOC130303239 [Hyla sarda]XP_056407735.1 uncharacterized protein LOC130303239 [Hyla sarda]